MKIQSALNTLLSSAATIGGQWYPNAAFDPQEDPIGSFYYTIDDPYCPPDTARFEVHIYSEPIFDLGQDRLLCPGDTTQFTLSISDVDLWWSDGSSQPVLVVTEPGTIWVDVTDMYDCHYAFPPMLAAPAMTFMHTKCTCPVLNAPRAVTPFCLEYPPSGCVSALF